MKAFLFGLTILAVMAVQPCLAAAGTVAPVTASAETAAPPPAPLTTFFSNLGHKYPNAVYYCCAGIPITGPNNDESVPEQWYAVSYTPSVNFTLERILLAVGYFSGTNNVVAAVYADSGTGVPGTQLGVWHVADMPFNGFCCTIKTVSTGGIPLTCGTKYWIALKTINNNKDALVFWERNTTDQVNSAQAAYYCSQDHQGSCTINDQWSAQLQRPAPAFALLGN